MSKKSCFAFVARDKSPVAEVFIFDRIGASLLSDGVVAREFAAELANHKDRDLLVRINSPGGSVFEGYAIYNALLSHPKHVECRIEGICASISTVIVLAGESVTMAKTASFMIHNPRSGAEGEAKDMRKEAALLEKITGQMADIYAARTGKSKDEILAAMDEETWLTAAEAKEWGFVDNVITSLTPSASFDLSHFANVPTALAKPTEAKAIATAKQSWARDSVNAIMRFSGVYNATNEQLERFASEYAKSPKSAQDLIASQIEDGVLLTGGAPVGNGLSEQRVNVESDYTAYMTKLNKFRNKK